MNTDPRPATVAAAVSCATPMLGNALSTLDQVLHVLGELVGVCSGLAAMTWYIFSYLKAKKLNVPSKA